MIGHDDETAADAGIDEDLFDSHGLLAGRAGDEVWPSLCLTIEADLEEKGWDLPTQLLAVSNPTDTEAAAGYDLSALIGSPEDGLTSAFGVKKLADLTQHPVDALWGFTAPSWAAALVLTFEGWSVPPLYDEDGKELPDELGHLRNADHPRRVESRRVMMVTRDGACYNVARIRGQEPEVFHEKPRGMLLDVVLRTLGVPTEPAPVQVGVFLGQLALNACLNMLAPLTDPLPRDTTGDSHGNGSEQWTVEVRTELEKATPEERQAMHTRIAVLSLTSAIARVSWAATEHGTRGGVPKSLRKFVRDAASRGRPEGSGEIEATLAAARAAASLAFTDLMAGKHSREMLPPEVTRVPADWADEGIAARRLSHREIASQDDLLAEIGRRIGTLPPELPGILGHCGWLGADLTVPVG